MGRNTEKNRTMVSCVGTGENDASMAETGCRTSLKGNETSNVADPVYFLVPLMTCDSALVSHGALVVDGSSRSPWKQSIFGEGVEWKWNAVFSVTVRRREVD